MKFLYSLILLILLVSCSGNSVDDKNCRFLLDLNILPIEINLQLPEYLNLNSTGNSFYIANAGNGGIIVTNIGFGQNATHTLYEDDINSNLPIYEIETLTHPKKVERDIEADIWTFNNHFGGRNMRFPYKFIFHIKKICLTFMNLI